MVNNENKKRADIFFAQIMRREGLEHLITTEKIEGFPGRGRQREKTMDTLTVWLHSANIKKSDVKILGL